MPLEQSTVSYLESQSKGRLSTVGPDGRPQNKPVGYSYNAELGTIDIGGFNMESSAKFRNIAVNPEVSFVVDDAVGEGAENMRFLEIRGPAHQARTESQNGSSAAVIRIQPRRLISWNVGDAHRGMYAYDADTKSSEGDAEQRPMIEVGDRAAADARAAAESLVAELQSGSDRQNAEISNRHFAADVMWGSPFGGTLRGYDELHAIHTRLKSQSVGGRSSRFEVVDVLTPAPGVVVTQVRRIAMDDSGASGSSFSELMMYVLVKRRGVWWVAAGHNTPIRTDPYA
jgi:PPOX class F420-dependent enzyme/OxyR family protein/uncharacterized protein (TIGR02246 family)